MKNIGVKMAILFAAFLSLSVSPALAADFYLLGSSYNDGWNLLDPTTISAAPEGHKIFHLAHGDSYDIWNEYTIEVDCASERLQLLSNVVHEGSKTSDAPNENLHTWTILSKGSNIAHIRDVVCQWPEHKPTGDEVLVFPDFTSAVEHVSISSAPTRTVVERGKSRAKMLALGCLMYSNDHNDTFPRRLSDIVPVSMTAEEFMIRSIDPLSQGGVTFLYLGPVKESYPPVPLIVSRGKTPDGKTIVAYSDGHVNVEVYPKP